MGVGKTGRSLDFYVSHNKNEMCRRNLRKRAGTDVADLVYEPMPGVHREPVGVGTQASPVTSDLLSEL